MTNLPNDTLYVRVTGDLPVYLGASRGLRRGLYQAIRINAARICRTLQRHARGEAAGTKYEALAARLESTADPRSKPELGRPLRDGVACGGNGASNPDSLSREEEGDCGGLLFLERSWTADKRAVPKIKSQEAVRIPRNADPNPLPDFAGFVVTASEP